MLPVNDLNLRISLNGSWDFSLGELRHGDSDSSDPDTWGSIQVPGAWEAQGYDRRLEGPATYRRQVIIPEEWDGSRIFLQFGAVSYACRIMVNGIWVGAHQGLWTPFALDVTAAARPGQTNLIEVEVYKPSHLPGARFPFRTCMAGFIPDLGTTFGGLWQEVSLLACQAWFDDCRLDADPQTGDLTCWFRTYSVGSLDLNGAIIDMTVSMAGERVAGCSIERSAVGQDQACCRILQPYLWSPEDPALYEVDLALRLGDLVLARISRRTGFRRLSVDGETLLFNGHPIFLRGILHWGWEPDRIAPRFDRAAVRAEIRSLKSLGFNLIKLCLFVPDQVYYDVADEEGIFLWQEWPMWLPEVDTTYAERVPGEYADYMKLTRHHPSVVLYSAGCELNEAVGPELLGRLDHTMRMGARGALFCDNSGMGEAYGGLAADFSDFADYHTYSDLHFFEEVLDHWRRDWKPTRPLIFGEFCDSDTYRDPEEVRRQHGGGTPWWMTSDNPMMDWRPEARPLLDQAKRMKAANLGFTAEQLKEISYKSSLAVRKFVLESVRRRAGVGGYVITALRDTPLTTPGIFDDFGRSKWSPDQLLPFNGENVLSLDGERRRRWVSGGDQVDRLDEMNEWAGEWVSRYLIFNCPGVVFQGKGRLAWHLTTATGEILSGEQVSIGVDLDGIRPREIAAIRFQMPPVRSAQELCLEAEFAIPGLVARNSWPIWSYPKPEVQNLGATGMRWLYDPGFHLMEMEELYRLPRLRGDHSPRGNGLVVASALPAWSEDFLKPGGRMILLQWGDGPFAAVRRPFWREAIRVFAPHPLWDVFGIGGELRFLGLSSDISLDLARLGESLPALEAAHPIFRRLDGRDFFVSEFILEAHLGQGVLLACTLRLAGGCGRQPSGLRRNVAGQALFQGMLDHLEKEL